MCYVPLAIQEYMCHVTNDGTKMLCSSLNIHMLRYSSVLGIHVCVMYLYQSMHTCIKSSSDSNIYMCHIPPPLAYMCCIALAIQICICYVIPEIQTHLCYEFVWIRGYMSLLMFRNTCALSLGRIRLHALCRCGVSGILMLHSSNYSDIRVHVIHSPGDS